MQPRSYSADTETAKVKVAVGRLLAIDATVSEPDASLAKSPSRSQVPRFSRVARQSEIKASEALSSIRYSHNFDDVIEIRSHPRHRASSLEQSAIITINVSGDRFQTHVSTLELYPETLLGDAQKRRNFFHAQTNEYFFDRHRPCFEAILYYYQSPGRLRRPDFVPLDTFLEEVAFFQLGPEALKQVHHAENVTEVKKQPMPKARWRRYLWCVFEYPQHSMLARSISLISIFFTLLSCVSLAVESLPQYTNNWDNICKLRANLSLNSTYVPRCSALFISPFFIIQTVCVAFFTIEFLLRLLSTPSYWRFLLSFFNWVDLTAIVPYYVFLIIQLADQQTDLDTGAVLSIRILRILRFSRLIKIYLIFRRFKSLRVLSATIKESLTDFLALITILTLLAFLFGSATYFAEQNENSDGFDSIPKATYWGIITITGVGYGDIYPITAGGRTLTCLCALFGSSTMGMLVSVLVDRYQRVYNRKMYITEKELANVDLFDSDEEETKAPPASPLPDRYQFRLSVRETLHDETLSHQFVTTMKKKLIEAIDLVNIQVDLQLTDHADRELWTISSATGRPQTRGDLL